MKTLASLLLVACACGVAAAAHAQGQPGSEGGAGAGSPSAGETKDAPASEPTRLFVGAGLGGGFSARYKVNGQSISFNDLLQGGTEKSPLVAVNLVSIGIKVTTGLYLGGHISAVAQNAKFPNTGTTHAQITNYLAAATWFPWESGLFLRAGVGPSVFVISNSQQTDRVTGLGLLIGGGYALQLGGAHHVTLTVEQTWQSYSSSATKPESSQASAVFLGYMYKN
jgi:hypothetical protein